MSANKIIQNLNPKQVETVKTTEGPVLVLAGAGSGKTRSIVHRIAYLIKEKMVSPKKILAVTFTNKAAGEMEERLENDFGIYTRNLWVGTFHSMCVRILRSESTNLPVSKNFTIFDQNDQKSIIKKVIKKLDYDKKNFPPKKVLNIISNHKNNLISYKNFESGDSYPAKIVKEIYKEYQQYLIKNNGADFDDLLMYTVQLFQENSVILKKYQKKFHYIMIDEYQDTNFAQYRFAKLLADSHKNICVVGDDDQSIYGWRGADIRNILNFEDDYADTKIIRMTQNYRSPKNVLSAANELISNNRNRHKKELWSKKSSGDKIELYQLQNEKYEAALVSEKVKEIISQANSNYSNIAVFYRTNAQSRVFETQFIHDNINYRIIGGVNFYQRKEIKDVLAYLQVLVNPKDNESLLRIINTPKRGIGKTTVAKLLDFASKNSISLFQALKNIRDSKNMSNRMLKNLSQFYELISKFAKMAAEVPLSELMKELISEIEIIDYYKERELVKGETRAENINELIASTQEFTETFYEEFGEEPNLTQFLQEISLLTDIDNVDEDEEAVSLMTMHNAKGLEFEYVFIVGLENGLIPHRNSLEDPAQIEEERRLLYVAMTRTMTKLFMTYTDSRRFYDKNLPNLPSTFIEEIPENYIKKIDYTPAGRKRKVNNNYTKSRYEWNTNHSEFKIGQRVKHKKFGTGKILSVRNEGEITKLTISFKGGQLKKILSDFVEKC